MKAMHVLVTGAGGKTGRHVIAALLARGARVRAWVHSGRGAPDWPEEQVDVLAGDLMQAALWERALDAIDAVYHIPPNMFPQEEALGELAITACEQAGVTRFVYHSVLHPHVEAMPHHWHKMRVEERLFTSDPTYTILQPTAYMQNLRAAWPSIRDQGILRQPYSPNARISLVHLEDVAQVAARVLTEPGHEYAIYELVGTAPLSQHEVAATFARILDRPVHAEKMPLEAWDAQATGLHPYARASLHAMFRYYDRHGLAGNPRVLRTLLGRDPTPLDTFIASLLKNKIWRTQMTQMETDERR